MNDDIIIPADDQQRIDALVSDFRHRIENLYRMAYLQGQIASETEARDKIKAKLAKVAA